MKKIKAILKWTPPVLLGAAFYYFVGISRPAWFCCIMDHIITWAWGLGFMLGVGVIAMEKVKKFIRKTAKEGKGA